MKKWLLVVAMLIASTSANALEFRTVCNTCATDGNFLAAAKKEVGNFNGSHTVYVINFETSVAKKYSVYQSVRYNILVIQFTLLHMMPFHLTHQWRLTW